MNFREASNSHGVAATVSFRWSRSSHMAFSHNHWLSLGDGSPVDHSVFDIYGVAVWLFLLSIGRGVQTSITLTTYGLLYLGVIPSRSMETVL